MTMTAEYKTSSFVEFIGNPLVEALPPFPEVNDLPSMLLVKPTYKPEERLGSMSKRLFALQRIGSLHIPTRADTDIALNLSRCLVWGYFGRGSVPRETVERAHLEAGYALTESEKRYLFGFTPPVYGFPVIGLSGVGKSTSVLNVLHLYPQVIRHTKYHSEPFNQTQVVWLKVDTPCDGSAKGLCTAIIQELDTIVGTQYSSEFTSSRVSKDILLVKVRQLVSTFHVGIIILDEFQNLCSAKKEVSRELLNFLVTLANSIRVPIVMVGSPLMTQIFQSSFQQAKRITGQGEVRMNLLRKEDKFWQIYFRALWNYQYTKQTIELSDEMINAFFDESVGNPFICSILYKLVQDDAIVSRREFFDISDVHRTASEKLGLTSQMRKDMLAGKDVDLSRLEPLWGPAMPEKEEAAEPVVVPMTTMQQRIAGMLIDLFKADADTAMSCVKKVIDANPKLLSESALTRLATLEFLKQTPQSEKE